MVTKRAGLIKFAGVERTVIGDDIQVGQKAPDFLVQKNDWSLSKAFKETRRNRRWIRPFVTVRRGASTKKPPTLVRTSQ